MLQDTVSYPPDERTPPKYGQIISKVCLINYNKLVNVVVNSWEGTDKNQFGPSGLNMAPANLCSMNGIVRMIPYVCTNIHMHTFEALPETVLSSSN